jgi:mRNA interferase RelE/StbE
MAHQVALLPAAQRDLERLPRNVQLRIGRALRALAAEPRPPGVVKLQGAANLWRIRIGQYRVVYEIHDNRLVVLGVAGGAPERHLSRNVVMGCRPRRKTPTSAAPRPPLDNNDHALDARRYVIMLGPESHLGRGVGHAKET